MEKRIIDNEGGIKTVGHYDDLKDEMIVERVQDVESVLKSNKALYNETTGYTPSKDMRHVASIPAVVVEDLIKRKIWDDKKKMKQWLNDPDNRFFRTSHGAV